ncbi:hypothetical protein [Vibrio sp. TBV020]|uniref:hypothetical protein n=1 Tax=Vibrio sp. TBV020 TaxID=3137398 RepID=UPI0038CD885A
MMDITLHALAHKGRVRSTISKLKKLSGHTHHYVSVRQGWVCVYGGDKPHQVRSEWWLDGLMARGAVESEQSFILVEELHDEQGRYWLCMVVERGVVKKLWHQRQPNWVKLNLEQAEQCFLVGKVPGLSGEVCESASDQELASVESYILSKQKRVTPWKVMSVAGLTLLAGLGGLTYYSTLEPTPPQTASPPTFEAVTLPSWALYRIQLSHAYDSEQVVKQARNLAVYLSQLPPGWKASAITQASHELTVMVNREPHGQIGVMKAWLDSRPDIKRFAHWAEDELTLQVLLYSGLPTWRDRVLPINPSWQNLQDALTILGATLELQSISNDVEALWQTRQWQVTHSNASLATLTQINTLLGYLPVGIETLTLTPTAQQGWALSFTLNLYGGL